LHPPKGVIAVGGLNPEDDVTLGAAALQGETESIMLVGHLPHPSRLLRFLAIGNPEVEIVRSRNAGIVCLIPKEGKWAIDWVFQPDLVWEAGKSRSASSEGSFRNSIQRGSRALSIEL
jgi:phosphohistidine phosphatase SixA